MCVVIHSILAESPGHAKYSTFASTGVVWSIVGCLHVRGYVLVLGGINQFVSVGGSQLADNADVGIPDTYSLAICLIVARAKLVSQSKTGSGS